MVHMKDRLISKPGLSGFSALVLHHIVVLLLTHSCGGQLQGSGTSQPIVAMVGDDVMLPCQLEAAVDASGLTVEWTRPDLEPSVVLLRRDGVQLQHEDNPSYVGRTSLSTNKLKRGDISMTLAKVKPSDAGNYKCLVPKSGPGSVVQLTVGSVSSPSIDIYKESRGVVMDCGSRGWYPEPEVLWLDGEGKLLSAGPTETVRGPDDLYTVSSRVTVEKRHSNSFTCRVQQRTTNQTREAHIRLSADLFTVQSSSAIRISICLAVCIVSVGAVVLVVWKWGRNKTKTTNSSIELQPLTEKTKEQLDEDLQSSEGELQHVQQVIETLMNLKKDLKNLRETLTSQQQENKIQIEENRKKISTARRIGLDSLMKKHDENLEKLQKREEELEELLENREKLLESTEEMINKMTERKGKLERDKEKMNKVLKETERHREIQSEPQSEREEEENQPITTP